MRLQYERLGDRGDKDAIWIASIGRNEVGEIFWWGSRAAIEEEIADGWSGWTIKGVGYYVSPNKPSDVWDGPFSTLREAKATLFKYAESIVFEGAP